MKIKFWSVLFSLLFCFGGLTQACINDSISKTLWEEKREHPTLAQAILHPTAETPDTNELTNRIATLQAKPNTNDPAWWNDLAGAYLRLGKSAEAVKILEPVTNRFATNYGIHANLGTAYHLLGRYQDAEREIRRDTEIDPEAHFGMEKYHLALLQYLSRSKGYQIRHLYVEEFTKSFLSQPIFGMKPTPRSQFDSDRDKPANESDQKQTEEETAELLHGAGTNGMTWSDLYFLYHAGESDDLPGYMNKWDLGSDPKLDDGVIYMATLNQSEPACWVMLGVVAQKKHLIHFAKAAFEKAVLLGSPQAPIVEPHLKYLNKFHSMPFGINLPFPPAFVIVMMMAVVYYIFARRRRIRRKRAQQ